MHTDVNSWGMIGHTWAVDLLARHITNQRIRHAYLITGPQSIGRRTLALRFAQSLNCPQPPAPGTPCRTCRTCNQIENLQHPDLSVIKTLEDKKQIIIDQIRELQRTLSLAPYEAPYRIALLLNFEEANPSAANALLKSLEEPPPKVIMLLTAVDTESLLPTIVSRCEKIRLRPTALDATIHGLGAHLEMDPQDAEPLARIAGGRPGFAINLHQNPEIGEQRSTWLDDHQELLRSNRVARFQYAEALSNNKAVIPEVLQTWLTLWRDVLLCSHGAAAPISNIDRKTEIDHLTNVLKPTDVEKIIRQIERANILLSKNVNVRLTAEVLMLELPYLR
ncbi:MAG: DNA polymerase III subunit [Chloroflexota bacterium]